MNVNKKNTSGYDKNLLESFLKEKKLSTTDMIVIIQGCFTKKDDLIIETILPFITDNIVFEKLFSRSLIGKNDLFTEYAIKQSPQSLVESWAKEHLSDTCIIGNANILEKLLPFSDKEELKEGLYLAAANNRIDCIDLLFEKVDVDYIKDTILTATQPSDYGEGMRYLFELYNSKISKENIQSEIGHLSDIKAIRKNKLI